MKVKRRYAMRKKDARKIGEDLALMGISLRGNLEKVETDRGDVILKDGKLAVILVEGHVIPAIPLLLEAPPDRGWVTVDMGAVPHLANGADVMAPGVVDADPDIREGDVVWVKDMKHGRPLCVGIALQDGKDMPGGKGRCVKTLHHAGDRFWKEFAG